MWTLMLYYALLRSRSVLDQLAEGLSALGVLEVMKLYPKLMEPHCLLQDCESHLLLVRNYDM